MSSARGSGHAPDVGHEVDGIGDDGSGEKSPPETILFHGTSRRSAGIYFRRKFRLIKILSRYLVFSQVVTFTQRSVPWNTVPSPFRQDWPRVVAILPAEIPSSTQIVFHGTSVGTPPPERTALSAQL
jgi:hypothetical protein